MSLSVVTHASTTVSVKPPASVTVTPTAANQLIVVIVNCDTSNSASISSNPSLNWIQQYNVNTYTQPIPVLNGYIYSIGSFILVWYAISTSNSAITITISSSSQNIGIEALVVAGANLNTPFETPSPFPLTAISDNGVFSITATFGTMVAKNELIVAAVGKAITTIEGVVTTFSLSANFGNLTFLDGNGSYPSLAYAYAITSDLLSNATITATWIINPLYNVADNPGMIVFAILPSSVTNYVPFGIISHTLVASQNNTSNSVTVNPTAAGQLILVFGFGPENATINIFSNPPLLWNLVGGVEAAIFSGMMAFYAITTSATPVTIYVPGFAGYFPSGTGIFEVLIISGANTINPVDQNPSLPAHGLTNNGTSITATFSTTSRNSLVIAGYTTSLGVGNLNNPSSSMGQPTIIDEINQTLPNAQNFMWTFNRVTKSLSNVTYTGSWGTPSGATLSIIAIVPQQNIINSIVPQFEPSLSNATQFSSFFNPAAITNFSYSDAILPIGTQNRKYNFTLYSITNDQLEDLFRLLQQPSVQLVDIEGNSHTVVITYINPTYTGGLVGIYQVDIEAIEQNA